MEMGKGTLSTQNSYKVQEMVLAIIKETPTGYSWLK